MRNETKFLQNFPMISITKSKISRGGEWITFINFPGGIKSLNKKNSKIDWFIYLLLINKNAIRGSPFDLDWNWFYLYNI